MPKRILAIALSLLAAVALQSGCSQPTPPPPPAAPAAPAQAKAPEKRPDTKATLSREERVRAIAKDKFELYERKIKVADFPRAEATLRDLRAVFDMESDYKGFWAEAIPEDQRIGLSLMSLCETCKDGLCPLCKGGTKCEACKGEGKCGNCDGRPVRKQACRACICTGCSGTGKCRACSGFKNKKCSTCQGYGTVGGTATTECKRCGGSGQVRGLKGPKGVSTLNCLTCKGTGKVPIRTLSMCGTCQGKGSNPCPKCGGVGRCASCKGAGRNASCAHCGGAGQTVHKCPQCDGNGKCISCEGAGHCKKCHGSGKCFECDGGVVRLYDFPVNSKWVTMKEGFILFDSRRDKVARKGDKIGFTEIKYEDLRLSFIVNKGQIVFIATQPAFDRVVSIIRK